MSYKLLFVLAFLGTLALSPVAQAQGSPLPDEKGTVAAAQAKVDADPKNVELIFALGNAQAAVWRINDSIATYTKGLAIDPDHLGLLLNRGHRGAIVNNTELGVSRRAWGGPGFS